MQLKWGMPYKLVVFDFDGTLADSFPWVASVINQVADEFHFEQIDQDEIETLRRMGAKQILKMYRVPFWKILPIVNRVRRLMTENIDCVYMFDGVNDLLQDLADRDLMLGVVTSNVYENVCHVLGPTNAGLIQFYECKVSPFGKPGRLKKLLHKSGVQPHQAIYIGDEIRDLEAARKVHMPFGAVAWGYTHPGVLKEHSPHEMFVTVEEIAKKLD